MVSRKVFGVSLVVTGLIVIACSIPLQLDLVAPNEAFGVRFSQAFAATENWYRLNRFGGAALALWGISSLAAGGLLLSRFPISRKLTLGLGLFYPFTIVIPVLLTYLYALSL